MEANIALTTFTSSAVVVWGIQRLKQAKWFPLLKEGQATISRVASIVIAFFVHLGISYQWNTQPDGSHTLIIANLSLATIGIGLWHWVNQFAVQETIYQAAMNKPSAPSLAQQASLDKQGAQVVAVEPNEVAKGGK